MWDEYAKSIGTTANKLTQAQKIQAEVNGILEETRFQTGDAAKLVNTYSGQIALLGYNFQNLKVQVGNAIMPIVQAVLPGINAIIAGLTKMATVFSQVTALLFGKSAQVKAQTGVASSAAAAADATDKLADATTGAGSASKKAAKDMKGVLAGFDELNILANNTAESLGDAAGGIDTGVPEIEIPSYESEIEDVNQLEDAFSSLGELFIKVLDDMLAAIPAFKQALLDFADRFNEFNQKLYDAFTFPGVLDRVKQLGEELADAFNALVNAIDWELWGRTLGAGLNLGLNFLTSFIYAFDWINLGNKLGEFINGLVYEIDWYEFGRLMWANFKIGMETFAGFLLGLDMPALAKAASNIVLGFFNSMQESVNKVDWAGIGRQIATFLNNINWVDTLASVAKSIAAGLNAMIATLGTIVATLDWKQVGVAFGNAFNELFNDIDWDGLGKAFSDGLIGVLDMAIAFIDTMDLTAVAEAFTDALTNVDWWSLLVKLVEFIFRMFVASWVFVISDLKAIAEIGGSIIKGLFMGIVDGLKNLPQWLKENVVDPIVHAVKDLFGIHSQSTVMKEIGVLLIEGLLAGLVEMWHVIVEFFSEQLGAIVQAFSDALAAIQEVWSVIGEWFDQNVIQPLVELFTSLYENIVQFFSDAWDGIVAVWETVSSWFDENVIQPVTQFFSDMCDNVRQFLSDLWDNIVAIWQGAAAWFETNVTGPLGKAFEAAAQFIKGVINGIIGTTEGMINAVIKAVNWLISQLNKIKIDIPDWVPAIGGKSFGFNIPSVSEVSLPRLANGAVIPPNQQFAAILGDQRSGKNLEAPANLIRQMVQEGIEAAGNVGRGSGNMTVIMEIDGKEFGRASYKYGTAEQQRVGVRLVGVGT